MKKKMTALVLAVSLLLALAACGTEPNNSPAVTQPPAGTASASGNSKNPVGDAEVDPSTIDAYAITVMSGGAAWSQFERGFLDACKELGINGYYLAPVDRNNATQMAELLDSAVTSKGDIIIGTFMSLDMFGPGLLQSRKNGAVNASVQVTLSEEYCDFQIGTDQEAIGIVWADTLIEYYEASGFEKLNFILGRGSASELTIVKDAALVNRLKEKGYDDRIIYLDEVFDSGSAVTAAEQYADYYKIYPELNCILCENSSAATMGAANFVQENHLEDQFITIGADASADILNYVLDGALDCTINQDFYQMGYRGIMLAYDLLVNGNAPESYQNDSGCYLIRPEDVEEYAASAGIDLG